MTSGTGNTTLLHAYIHLRNQQAFQRVIAQVSAQSDSSGIALATSPRSPKSSKNRKDKDDAGLDVNARDHLGRTPLHLAAAMTEPSSAEYVRMLLKCPSVNVNLPDRESAWTALHRAMYVGNLGVILLLLQHPNTDPSLKDYEGYTAFDLYNSTIEGTRPPIGASIAPATSNKDAELFTWGTNRNASLGHGDTSDRHFPDQVTVPRPLSSNVHSHSTSSSETSTPVELRFLRPGVRQVKMGRLHTAVISTFPKSITSSSTASSTVFSRATTTAMTLSGVSLSGFGSGGRLGLTQHTQYALRPLPFSSSGPSSSTQSATAAVQNQMPGSSIQNQGQTKIKVVSVALGQDHTLALTADGEVFSWGLNRFAQLGYVVEREDVGSGVHSATFGDESGNEFSSGGGGGGNTNSSEQIQLTPRRVYAALKKEFVVGIAACKSASVCWVRTGSAGGAPGSGASGMSTGNAQIGSGLIGGSEGGNVYTWGLNSGQLGYERTVTGSQLQVLPRKVTKITKPVVQIALGESAMACLLGGTGSGKGDVLIVWGDRVTRVNFPSHTFPSSISPYRPPQALKSTRIVKIVCSDEPPPAWTASTLSALTSTASGSTTPLTTQQQQQQQHSSSASQLSRMMSAMSSNYEPATGGGSGTGSFSNNPGGSSLGNLAHFACVSEGGEVFVFGVPGAPPVGVLGNLGGSGSVGSGGDGGDGGSGGGGGFMTVGSGSGSKSESIATGKLFKPQRVWGLKKGLVGAVRDVAIGAEGSLIVCTDSGHVYVRSRSSAVTVFDSGAGVSKGTSLGRGGLDGVGGTSSTSGGGKSQKFVRVPSLQRIVGVSASSTGAFGALRVDVDVEPVGTAKEALSKKSGDSKGWDLVRDMKSMRPWMWTRKLTSPLEREWAEKGGAIEMDDSTSGFGDKGMAMLKEKDEEDDEDDKEIEKDMQTLRAMSQVVASVMSPSAGVTAEELRWEERDELARGADMMVSVASSNAGGQKRAKGKISKASASTMPGGFSPANVESRVNGGATTTEKRPASQAPRPFSVPAHQIFLASRSKLICTALSSSKEEALRDASSGISIRLFSSVSGGKTQRRMEFSQVHPLTVLVLLEYLYTDELVAVWDRRVAKVLDNCHGTTMKGLKLSSMLAPQIKSELQTLGRLLDLQEMLRGMESTVKKPIASTLRKDLDLLFWSEKHNKELTTELPHTRLDSPVAIKPDVVLMLSEGKQIYTYSAVLRARSVYFDDFLGDKEWTKHRRDGNGDGLLKVDLKHVRWSVMEFVVTWMCCGLEEGVFGSLSFANSVDEVLEFLFEVLATANELLLSPLILLTSEMILKFLHVSNACYILTEASHYHAYPLVASVQGYIARNLETFLESRMLEDMSPAIIKQLSAFIHSKQEEKASYVRGGLLINQVLATWKDWLENEDFPTVIVPSVASQKRERERRISQATKTSPSSPLHLSMTAMGKQREVFVNAQGSPVLKARTSSSPILKPKTSTSPLIRSKDGTDEIFDMDDMDIGPPSIPVEKSSTTLGVSGPAWKTSSAPRVDMRALMAEAATTSESSRPVPVYVPPRGSPGTSLATETSFNSLRMRQKPPMQRSVSGLFDGPSTPPSNPRSGSAPWKTNATQSPGQPSPVPAKEAPSPSNAMRTKDSPVPVLSRTQSGQGNMGPIFTPSRQPTSKPSPGVPRRVSSSTNKAWSSTPFYEPAAQSTAGMSFVAIQQLQLEQGAGTVKDKRSLLEIQQEEQARREEADFLKWWEAEEERVRLETEAAMRLSMESSRGGAKKGNAKGPGQGQKPRKPRAPKNSGPNTSEHNGEKPSNSNAKPNTSGGEGRKRGPKGKKVDKAPPT
ncbi:hypothetical protein K435DRAFT_778780 [Dendrothele bispora CBS 962.96]|uniref:BTB domain-containing protein n=1 Tax=Dendrothele bispora (strain CBS 962.96) TaxID=1314807 RepID=A0A4S8M1P8_DENBC|nr:hypothetical protein K435DRAFT_778780 [Dendrothele bispora CBS 962.96]